MKRELPDRIVRVMGDKPTVDLKSRTISATVATRKLARDGGILLPRGLVLRAFEANPVVQAMHGFPTELRSPVIGRCTAISVTDSSVVAETQFADTDVGREYFYLYGGNEAGEVYMRAWSFGWNSLSTRWITLAEARTLLASDWDETLIPDYVRQQGEVWVCDRGEMLEYSAVPVGADRAALSRAMAGGNRAAAGMVATIDLTDAAEQIKALRAANKNLSDRLDRIEQDHKALRGEGAAAAARGDTAGLLDALKEIARNANPNNERGAV